MKFSEFHCIWNYFFFTRMRIREFFIPIWVAKFHITSEKILGDYTCSYIVWKKIGNGNFKIVKKFWIYMYWEKSFLIFLRHHRYAKLIFLVSFMRMISFRFASLREKFNIITESNFWLRVDVQSILKDLIKFMLVFHEFVYFYTITLFFL